MDTVIEQQRRLHEERERVCDTMVREWLHDKKTNKEKINSEHRMKLLLDRYVEATSSLKVLYEDRDGSRKDEIRALSGPNEFAEFYTRLKNLKDFHRNHPNEIAIPLSIEFQEMNEAIEDPNRIETDLVEFTDEEGYGRYLDLHECFEKYINLKGVERVDYITYLGIFEHLYEIPREHKTADYKKYVETLLEYLADILSRVKPLMDLNEELSNAIQNFQKKWEDGTFPGWPKESSSAMSHTGAYLDLTPFTSADELMSLGLDRLKSALLFLGLKCGGLFETKGKRKEDLDQSLFSKSSKTAMKDKWHSEKSKEVAMIEAQVYHLAELVSDMRTATKENVERKQARSYGEDDEDEEIPAAPSEDEDEDEIPYNPKNLPLGWDGKPIPYWLYKLHGLNISFPCEICGNQIYKGPKAFQRHFSEWRHAHGMRCLGIPNTAHFANITQIADALELWAKLREQKDQERFKPEVDEEYEDTQGNVVNKKTYEDLRRQGLL
ncbi:unnamed protein product [Soboliphyme baturini]|uniref:Matrin-type domain-containing protein n=1 Tax=Soboliphyme baturini TaxID=241478 RepID=A0A183IF21_9BILA|nr:unnamed protein product [Soboliphyme baturini]